MRIAAIQMVSGFVLEENLAQAKKLVIEAAHKGADLVVLPEMFAVFGGGDQCAVGAAEKSAGGPIRTFLSSLAKQCDVHLVAGTIPTMAASDCLRNPQLSDRVYAACYYYDNQGRECGRYDKTHLFDADVADQQGSYRESDTFSAGNFPGIFDSPWGKFGVAVCYDLRFPEYSRRLIEAGCRFVVVPAAFTYATGEAHWQLLLRARAVENLCFMIGAAQGGQHSLKRRTWGQSCIVNPWGEVLEECAEGAGIVTADLDFDYQDECRQQLPVLCHRRQL